MATRTNNNRTYYINPAYLTFNENSGYGANLIQVSASSSCWISVYDKTNGINYSDADKNYQRWKVTAYNNKFPDNDAYRIYVRLEREGTSALIVYSKKVYNVDGSSADTEASADYYYIYIGDVSATDGTSIRSITYDTGYLESDQGYEDANELNEMWELDKYNTPWLVKAKQWLHSFTVKGFISLIGGLIFKTENDEKVITDIKRSTDNDESVPVSDETLPTTKYISNIIEDLDDRFLRKDQDDRTEYSLGVGGDLTIEGKTTSKGGIQLGKEFQSGLLGKGANIDEAGQAELHSLFVRTFMEVPELRYNRVTVRMGDSITSCSAGIVKSVNILSETSGTIELKLEDGEFGSLEEGDIVFQIFSDMENKENNATETSDDGKGNRTIKGFATVMFKVTGVSGERKEIIAYSLRPLKKQIHPFQFGTFSQRGSFDNTKPERQIVIYEGIYPQPYTRYMFGVNDWEFSSEMIGMQLGDLSNLSVFGMDMSGYSAYLNNVYFTGMIRQLYIPQWMKGESAAQNGTLVYMGGDHYVAKEDTSNPPLFDLADEDGRSLLFTDEDGEGNLIDFNNDEYDMFAKKGDDGVGIKSNVSYYLISETNSKPSESSLEWSSSMVQPTDLKPYLWKKTVVTYTNLVSQTTIECISVRGKDGTSVNVKGSYKSETELKAAFPNGPTNASDAYIVGGDLYVWTGSAWKNVGAIKGEKGDTAYIHLKYANETSSGTQVNVGGSVVTLSFTSNDGEDMGDWMGVYTDHTSEDSNSISDYKWKKIRGDKGVDSTSYWLDSPIGTINFTSDGYPNPTSFVVTMKKKSGNGDVTACSDFYLATWKYDGVWQFVDVTDYKASSIQIEVARSTVYTQYRVTAHTTNAVNENTPIVTQLGIGISVNGERGDKGDEGLFVYDAGFYDSNRAYYYKEMSDGKVRRDKIVYGIGGSFYNFLVRTRQDKDSYGLINTPPTRTDGDEHWEVMSEVRTFIANTLFGTNANIGGFMTSNETMISQTETNGEPNIYMNGKTGEFRCTNAFVRGHVEATSGSIEGALAVGQNFVIDGSSTAYQGFYYYAPVEDGDSYGSWKFQPRSYMTVPRDCLMQENNTGRNVLMYLERARNKQFDRVFYAKGISEFNGRVAISSYNAVNTTASHNVPALFVEGGIGLFGGFHCEPVVISKNASALQNGSFNFLYEITAGGISFDLQSFRDAASAGKMMLIVDRRAGNVGRLTITCPTGGFVWTDKNRETSVTAPVGFVLLVIKTSDGDVRIVDLADA